VTVPGTDRTQEIEQRVNAATPAPWKWNPDGSDEQRPRMFLEARGRLYQHVLKITWPELLSEGDAEFIAHAREDVPWLLAERAGLLERVRSLEAQDTAIGALAFELTVEANAAQDPMERVVLRVCARRVRAVLDVASPAKENTDD
jgi:hypothetical protein